MKTGMKSYRMQDLTSRKTSKKKDGEEIEFCIRKDAFLGTAGDRKYGTIC